jgi:hypothetical protein
MILYPTASVSASVPEVTEKETPFPVAMDIPAIDAVANPLEPLELDYKDELEVPPVDQPWKAGWFVDGVRPGDDGPAVIAAHVNGPVYDSLGRRFSIPGLFYQLHNLKPGDQVHILRSDDSEVTFEVYGLEKYSKDAFPTEKVYGNTKGPELRLITCGGAYNHEKGHFEDNWVAYLRIVI